ncbi:hypothetical protein SAMN05421874_102301 [Nonomuraea maritima]|uniref:Uncharacterized protein n=1 Tax=Nonomuraea maritima TaxID=683260 RepID=A0A1G8UZ24_9ACTN|nr:hypothetical protein [Nonomuraea maritima]SDJ58200.1 hypothetical protein SAMN05421874_102301 [Nonomuraea maritima]
MASRSAAVLAGGKNVVRLFVAALAFTGAYAGLSASGDAGYGAEPAGSSAYGARPARLPASGDTGPGAQVSASGEAGPGARPVGQVELSVRATPAASAATPAASGRPGTVTVDIGGRGGCTGSYVARSLLVNPAPGTGLRYHWRLARWSPTTGTWRTYQRGYDGFTGADRAVEWRPEIAANPGTYRVELTAGRSATVTSERFQVSC